MDGRIAVNGQHLLRSRAGDYLSTLGVAVVAAVIAWVTGPPTVVVTLLAGEQDPTASDRQWAWILMGLGLFVGGAIFRQFLPFPRVTRLWGVEIDGGLPRTLLSDISNVSKLLQQQREQIAQLQQQHGQFVQLKAQLDQLAAGWITSADGAPASPSPQTADPGT